MSTRTSYITALSILDRSNTIQPVLMREKLQAMGVDTSTVSWITDYLTGRPQFVWAVFCPKWRWALQELRRVLYSHPSSSLCTPQTFRAMSLADVLWWLCSGWVYKWWEGGWVQSAGGRLCGVGWKKSSASDCCQDDGDADWLQEERDSFIATTAYPWRGCCHSGGLQVPHRQRTQVENQHWRLCTEKGWADSISWGSWDLSTGAARCSKSSSVCCSQCSALFCGGGAASESVTPTDVTSWLRGLAPSLAANWTLLKWWSRGGR